MYPNARKIFYRCGPYWHMTSFIPAWNKIRPRQPVARRRTRTRRQERMAW
jgi:hypothetical protein